MIVCCARRALRGGVCCARTQALLLAARVCCHPPERRRRRRAGAQQAATEPFSSPPRSSDCAPRPPSGARGADRKRVNARRFLEAHTLRCQKRAPAAPQPPRTHLVQGETALVAALRRQGLGAGDAREHARARGGGRTRHEARRWGALRAPHPRARLRLLELHLGCLCVGETSRPLAGLSKWEWRLRRRGRECFGVGAPGGRAMALKTTRQKRGAASLASIATLKRKHRPK